MHVLFFDTETAPIITATYALYDVSIPYTNVLQDWFFICAAWSWNESEKLYSTSLLDDPKRFIKDHTDDYAVVKRLHDAISEADVVVAHNLHGFDYKRLEARIIFHKLPPLKRPLMVDTLKEARKFGFTSKKLDSLAKQLGLRRKEQVEKDLFVKASQGDVKAIRGLIRYNKNDIPPLKDLYLRLRPYMQNHPNGNLFRGKDIDCCPKCNSTDFQARGFIYTATTKKPRYSCKDCQSWFCSTKSIKRVRVK